MTPIADCAAFSFRGTAVSVGEVLLAAHFRNELEPCASSVALGVASEEEAARWRLEADEGAIEAMVDGFRYEKSLISADEAEAWLNARGMTQNEFQDYFIRRYWRETLREKIIPDHVDLARVVPDLLGLLHVEVLMSGAFGPIATALSRRHIARAAAKAPPDEHQVKAERGRFLGRTGLKLGTVDGWLEAISRDHGWLDGMLEMEASYRLECRAILTPERLAQALAAERVALTRLQLERVEFGSADAALKAHLRVRGNGSLLEEVARESRCPFKRFEVLAEDLPEDQMQKLLCATIGEVQKPAPAGGVLHLTRVIRRSEPTLADVLVRARVEQRVLNACFSEAAGNEVRWFIN